jgi:hypothetical protein
LVNGGYFVLIFELEHLVEIILAIWVELVLVGGFFWWGISFLHLGEFVFGKIWRNMFFPI